MKFQIIYTLVYLAFFGIKYAGARTRHLFVPAARKRKLHEFYSMTFHFYNLLTEKEKRKFLNRCYYITRGKKIKIGKEILHLKPDIERLMVAAIAQVTFGYRDYELDTFPEIIISRSSFYSRLVKAEVKGLTLGNGRIFYSWEDFLEGYLHQNDKVNLAIHELAHALYIEKFRGTEIEDWLAWQQHATIFLKNKDAHNRDEYFREYGLSNISEFWAVNVECFFEDPANFKARFPHLYQSTARLLKQDMALRKMAG